MNDDKKTTSEQPLIVLVGPTASGKSSVAMEIAQAYKGEIICADSRTIYKGMDIGTAKPTLEDQRLVPHWGLDLVEPGEKFSAADFKSYATQKIAEIRARGAVPMLVGGTGLYIDGIIFDYQFGEPNPELRAELEALDLDQLKEYCKNNNISLPENEGNKRYVVRAIEQGAVNTKRVQKPLENTIIVGITTEAEVLRERITKRADELFESGMIEEGAALGEKYGWGSEAMTGNVYPLVRQYLNGDLTQNEVREKFITADWRLAKRQRTWLKRNSFIQWLPLSEAAPYIAKRLK